jgi:hypothetical protein
MKLLPSSAVLGMTIVAVWRFRVSQQFAQYLALNEEDLWQNSGARRIGSFRRKPLRL